jgi:acetyl esterase/lipase
VDLESREDKKGFGDVLMAGKGADVFGRDAAVMKEASPIRHVTKDLPPVLLVVGERAFPMLEGDAKAFVEKARDAKVPASLLVAKGRDHMGVVKSLVEEKSPVLERVLAFVENPRE